MTTASESNLEYIRLAHGPGWADLTDGERTVLAEVNQRVAAAESVEAIVDFLFDRMELVLPCDRIGIALLEPDGDRLVSHHNRARYEPVLLTRGYTEDLAGSSLKRVMDAGVLRIIHDLEHYGRSRPGSKSTQLLLKEGVRSSVTVPLAVEGRNVGVLFRSARQPDAYGAREAHMLAGIADRLSQAVDKAWRIEQLTAANHAYTEMLGFISHELKSPVAAMVMNAEVLAEGYLGAITDEQRARLQRIVAKGRYLTDMIGEYLNLARIEGGRLDLSPIHVADFPAEVLALAVDVAAPAAENKGMTIHLPAPPADPAVECDPALMRIVLTNLLSNAVKYGRDGGRIDLDLQYQPGRLICSVRNEGPGFSAEQRGKLFRKFSRLDDPQLMQRKGTGLGLYTCWRIIQLHGGRIDARSEPGQWAEFSFWIPQPLGTKQPDLSREIQP